MISDIEESTGKFWRGIARSHTSDEVTFIVAVEPDRFDWHVETITGENVVRLGKGAYFFNGKQYVADDPDAP